MNKNLIAKVSISTNAPIAAVWNALVNPQAIKQYMFGTNVVSEWKEREPIVWKGEWQVKLRVAVGQYAPRSKACRTIEYDSRPEDRLVS